MKVTKIQVEISQSEILSSVVMRAICNPFGSLTEGVDPEVLGQQMFDFLRADRKSQPERATKVLKTVWGATSSEFSQVLFGRWEVALVTPTSKTKIRFLRVAGPYVVEVSFPQASEKTATRIMMELLLGGINFGAFGEKDLIPSEVVVRNLAHRARRHLQNVLEMKVGPGGWSQEYYDQQVAIAQREVDFFSGVA